MGAPCTMQREATLRDDAERLEAEAVALEASCASLEAENASIEAVMKLRLGDAHIGAPVKALLPVVDADPCPCTACGTWLAPPRLRVCCRPNHVTCQSQVRMQIYPRGHSTVGAVAIVQID